MADNDRTASLMTPSKLAQVSQSAEPVSPAEWLNQMAADAGHPHLQRLGELRGLFEKPGALRDSALLAAELEQLGQALLDLDFKLVGARAWWVLAKGKSRDAGARFVTQVEQIDEAVQGLTARVQALQKKYQTEAGASDRVLVEFEVEYRAVNKIVDRGTRWLQDMRNQLKAREAATGGVPPAQQDIDDAARCEILLARLKLLRAAANAAKQAHQHTQASATRRQGLMQLLQQALASDVRAWHDRLRSLAAVAPEGDVPAPSIEAAMHIHGELLLCMKQAAADCAELQSHEEALGASLVALGEQLKAAG